MRDLIARASTTVHAPASAVWRALTDPQMIKQYMFGTTVVSDWQEGDPIVWQGEWRGALVQDPRTNPNNVQAEHVADAFIWVPSIEPVVALATKNGLTPARGPERYNSSPVATTEVVYPDNSGYWLCFAEAHL